MDKVTMYRATKLVVYRNRSQVLNEAVANEFFTSKMKAVDALRRYSEEVADALNTWARFQKGEAFAYRDVFVSLWVYEEQDGVFVRTDSIGYSEILDGEVEDNSEAPEFETF